MILFYGWFGVVMFIETAQGKRDFENLVEGVGRHRGMGYMKILCLTDNVLCLQLSIVDSFFDIVLDDVPVCNDSKLPRRNDAIL